MFDDDKRARELKLDGMLADSFPASDPPSFTPVMGVGGAGAGERANKAPHSRQGAVPVGGHGDEDACVRLRRAYERPGDDDGYRVLVDRVWPRGVRRDELSLAEWNRDIAPSDELRRWYGHEVDRWPVFRERYRGELTAGLPLAAVDALTRRAASGRLTLVVGARDVEHSQGAVLRELIDDRLAAGK